MSDRIDEIYADTTPLGKARSELFSIGSQDMPVGSDEVLKAIDAFERAVRQDQIRREINQTRKLLEVLQGLNERLAGLEAAKAIPGAWAEIVCFDGSDEWLTKCSAALAEVQTETSRRNSRWILASIDPDVVRTGHTSYERGKRDAAKMIDPDAA